MNSILPRIVSSQELRWIGLFLGIACCSLVMGAQSPIQLQPTPKPPTCNEYVIEHTKMLSFGQRACLYRSSIVSGSGVTGAAFFAGISHLRNSPSEWGQGITGFSRRFGSNFGQSVAKSTGEFTASYLLHEDPRLRPMSATGAYAEGRLKRLGRALAAPVVIWQANPRPRFGYIAGSFASGFVGMAWYPQSQLHTGDALLRTATAFGGYVGNSVVTEFAGDIVAPIAKFFNKH